MKVEFLDKNKHGIYTVACIVDYVPETRITHASFKTNEKEFVFNDQDKKVYIYQHHRKDPIYAIPDIYSYKLTNQESTVTYFTLPDELIQRMSARISSDTAIQKCIEAIIKSELSTYQISKK